MPEKNVEILKFLKTKIDLWVSAHEGRNLSILARRTGQTPSYLYRLAKMDAEINLQKLMPILDEICSDSEVIDFYQKHYKEVAQVASRINQYAKNLNDISPGKARKAGELKDYIKDPNYFHIIALCTAENGVPRSIVIQQLGTSVSELINELLEKNILSLTKNDELFLDGHFFFEDRSAVLGAMKSTVEIFSKRRDGVVLSFDNNCYTIEAIKSIQSKMKEVDEYLDKLRRDPKSKGKIPFCYLAALGRIDFPSNISDERK